MKNTGIVYKSEDRKPQAVPEFAELLPNLSDEQYTALKADILQNGCYSPVIVDENMRIIDGHNRQRICEENNISYTMAVFAFEDDTLSLHDALPILDVGYPKGQTESGQMGIG